MASGIAAAFLEQYGVNLRRKADRSAQIDPCDVRRTGHPRRAKRVPIRFATRGHLRRTGGRFRRGRRFRCSSRSRCSRCSRRGGHVPVTVTGGRRRTSGGKSTDGGAEGQACAKPAQVR